MKSVGSPAEQLSTPLDREHEWALVGAREKARSVVALTEGMDISTLLEVGCGSGAVLEQLDHEGFAERYYAIEPSAELVNYMRSRGAIGRLVDADAATLRGSRLGRERYDLVVLSHVLEHVEDPGRILCDALDIGELVLVEVPLEGSFLGNLRAAVRRRSTGAPRRNNPAGHIQYFGYRDIRALVHSSGGDILRERIYVPRAGLWYQFARESFARKVYHAAVLALSRLAPALWGRFYYGHFACLVSPRPSMETPDRSRWPSFYHYEPGGGESP